jgi:acyl-coenzyme A thioesterase PaaI-like protein
MGKTIAFTEAELFDQDDQMVARGSFSSRLVSGGVPGDQG